MSGRSGEANEGLRMSLSTVVRAVLALTFAFAVGCSDDAPPPGMDAGELDAQPRPDVPAVDSRVAIPDGARRCTVAADCDDGVLCTTDICVGSAYCENRVNLAPCDDGIFCNGIERCDPIRDCQPGPPESCNDDNVCTIDRCDEPSKSCMYGPRDFDEDGDADWHCTGGGDCDDTDPAINSAVAEICVDSVDNDCDEMTDEVECGRPRYDVCDDPLDVSAGGSFNVDMRTLAYDVQTNCGGTRRDAVLTFTLAEPKDVRIASSTLRFGAISIRNTCAERTSELECKVGYSPQIGRRALPAGTYFVIVSGDTGDLDIPIDVTFSPASPAPTNESCAAPFDVGTGGSFPGTFLDVASNVTTRCGASDSPDLVYRLELTEPKDVVVRATTTAAVPLNVSVRRGSCTSSASEVRCVAGRPAETRLYSAMGTYFIVVEGPSTPEVDFVLDVNLADPTSPPAGDTCANPIALTTGTDTPGTLADRDNDLALSCGLAGNREIIYTFTTTEDRDITVNVDASALATVSLRPTCDADTGQLFCDAATRTQVRRRNVPAGTYFVVVEAATAATFTIRVDTAPPTIAVPVTGNDNCATAHEVPATGGFFTGSTVSLLPDLTASCGGMAMANDASFRLVLEARKRVIASLEGSSYDTVLHLHGMMCMTSSEITCNDDSGVPGARWSRIDRVLEPGTYHYMVDGFGSSATGAYSFEVLISEP